ncbi:MAG: hypothetical protein BWY63_00302 [Chloroflexi bacterium ADurb.Bin360]|nr:MAG: hypothetical protein BWY63_00302 [Chloroflexi bacterium ADurb.Bin360]
MQRRCAVEQYRAIANYLLKYFPHLGTLPLDKALGSLDVGRVVVFHQALNHERTIQLQRHGLGQTALVHLEVGSHNNHRTTGIVYTLTQQITAEAPLLSLEQVA